MTKTKLILGTAAYLHDDWQSGRMDKSPEQKAARFCFLPSQTHFFGHPHGDGHIVVVSISDSAFNPSVYIS